MGDVSFIRRQRCEVWHDFRQTPIAKNLRYQMFDCRNQGKPVNTYGDRAREGSFISAFECLSAVELMCAAANMRPANTPDRAEGKSSADSMT
jgi:hypothetical protein